MTHLESEGGYVANLTQRDVSNIISANRIDYLGGKSLIQWLLAELKKEGFHPKTD
jgi:hypothetical protein